MSQKMSSLIMFKGALRGFGEEIQTRNSNIYKINEVMIQTQGPQNTVWS